MSGNFEPIYKFLDTIISDNHSARAFIAILFFVTFYFLFRIVLINNINEEKTRKTLNLLVLVISFLGSVGLFAKIKNPTNIFEGILYLLLAILFLVLSWILIRFVFWKYLKEEKKNSLMNDITKGLVAFFVGILWILSGYYFDTGLGCITGDCKAKIVQPPKPPQPPQPPKPPHPDKIPKPTPEDKCDKEILGFDLNSISLELDMLNKRLEEFEKKEKLSEEDINELNEIYTQLLSIRSKVKEAEKNECVSTNLLYKVDNLIKKTEELLKKYKDSSSTCNNVNKKSIKVEDIYVTPNIVKRTDSIQVVVKFTANLKGTYLVEVDFDGNKKIELTKEYKLDKGQTVTIKESSKGYITKWYLWEKKGVLMSEHTAIVKIYYLCGDRKILVRTLSGNFDVEELKKMINSKEVNKKEFKNEIGEVYKDPKKVEKIFKLFFDYPEFLVNKVSEIFDLKGEKPRGVNPPLYAVKLIKEDEVKLDEEIIKDLRNYNIYGFNYYRILCKATCHVNYLDNTPDIYEERALLDVNNGHIYVREKNSEILCEVKDESDYVDEAIIEAKVICSYKISAQDESGKKFEVYVTKVLKKITKKIKDDLDMIGE